MDFNEKYDPELYRKAKKRVEELKGFYWHLLVFVIFNSFMFLNYFVGLQWTGGIDLYVVLVVFFGWGIGLALHAWQVFGFRRFLGHDWEERKIKEFMKEDTMDGDLKQ